MKKYLFAWIILAGMQLSLQAQCCPYIDSLYILPANPQPGDSIRFVYSVATPTISYLLSRTVLIEETTIEVDVCYTATAATAISYFKDTLELGILETGDYQLSFRASLTGDTLVCYVDDYQSQVLSFSVGAPNSISIPIKTVSTRVFPNPASTSFTLEAEAPFNTLRMFNATGELVWKQTYSGKRLTTNIPLSNFPNGLYWVEIQHSGQEKPQVLPLQIIR
jgi:hypothetical protein